MSREVRAAAALPAAVVAAALTILGAPTPAAAAPSVMALRATPAGGSKIAIEVDAAFGAKGRLTVQAEALQPGSRIRSVRFRKRVRPGTRKVTFRLDARRARVRRATSPVTFELTATAEERGSPPDTVTATATLPVPLVLLPGLGNEQTPGSLDAFATLLDTASGGVYGVGSRRPFLVVHGYDSAAPLAALAADLGRAATKLRRGTVFARVDVVGYSMGGLVARQWLAGRGRGQVRKLVFLGTPNEGAPIAFLLGAASKTGALETLLANAGGGALTGLADAFVTPETVGALRTFYPTYDWATVQLFPPFPASTIPSATLETFLGETDTQLDDLNARAPDPATEFHAFYYTSVPTELVGVPVGTVDQVDLTGIFAGGSFDLTNVDLAALASGDGDGIVPAHSVTMDEVPAWSAVIEGHDLGAGTHVTFTIDPQVYLGVASVLGE